MDIGQKRSCLCCSFRNTDGLAPNSRWLASWVVWQACNLGIMLSCLFSGISLRFLREFGGRVWIVVLGKFVCALDDDLPTAGHCLWSGWVFTRAAHRFPCESWTAPPKSTFPVRNHWSSSPLAKLDNPKGCFGGSSERRSRCAFSWPLNWSTWGHIWGF